MILGVTHGGKYIFSERPRSPATDRWRASCPSGASRPIGSPIVAHHNLPCDLPTQSSRFFPFGTLFPNSWKEYRWALSAPCEACHFVADFHSSSSVPRCACLSKSRHCIEQTDFSSLPQRANRLPPSPRSNITRMHALLLLCGFVQQGVQSEARSSPPLHPLMLGPL
jgi:hypothetical protein